MTRVLTDSPYLKACRGEPAPYTPIWLNRQGGRYMPEYRELKGNTPGLEWFTTPDLMTQVTLDAQRILGVDAAILFADLLPILVPLGLNLDYVPNLGPVFDNPIRRPQDVEALRPLEASEQLAYVELAIKSIRSGLPADIPLIGFAGAPFTLASYAIEGQNSKNYLQVKGFMYKSEQAWNQLMERLTQAVIDYVQLQIAAGVQAIQIFDSWVGCLAPEDFHRYVRPYSKALFEAITGQVPVVYFGTGNSHLVDAMFDCGADIMGLDWRTPMKATWERLGCRAIQGNLDPALLFADWPVIEQHTRRLLDEISGKPGHIFNLGHGILPQTPVDNVRRLVAFVQEYSSQAQTQAQT